MQKQFAAIGFDHGGVIGGVNTGNIDFNRKVCELLQISQDTYSEVYFSMNHLMMTGEMASWNEFWSLFVDRVHGDRRKVEEIMELNQAYERNLTVVDGQVLGLVDLLRERGYKVGLLSNTTLVGAQSIRAQKIDQHFDTFFASAEQGLMKPNPQAFRQFAKELGVKLTELVFIDDSPKSLSTAEECGFTPILFKSYDQLVAELTKLEII